MTLRPLQLLDERPGLPQFDLPDELQRLYGGGLGFPGAMRLRELRRDDRRRRRDARDRAVERDRLRRERGRPVRDGAPARRAPTSSSSARGRCSPRRRARGAPTASIRAAAEAYAELRRRLGQERASRGRDRHRRRLVRSDASRPRAGRARADDGARPRRAAGARSGRDRGRRGERRRLGRPAARDRRAARPRARARALGGRADALRVVRRGGLVDELFLTVSPLLAGRVGEPPPLARRRRGAAAGRARRGRARCRSGGTESHLFLRYGSGSLLLSRASARPS